MKKWHMIVDLEKCVGCHNCVMACKDEHIGNDWGSYTGSQHIHEGNWVDPIRHERGVAPYTEVCYVTKMCQHCDNPKCAEKFPGLVRKRADGLVLFDVAKARGNKALKDACPYGAIQWNEELQTAQKCTMCAHLLDQGWKEPRCVQACPLRALKVVHCEDEEWEKIVKQQKLKPLYDDSCKPRVMYKHLYKYTKNFVAGALFFQDGDIERVAADATIKLSMNGVELMTVAADFLGEFKIDRLPKDSGTYELEFTMPGFKPMTTEFTMEKESVVIPCMKFEK